MGICRMTNLAARVGEGGLGGMFAPNVGIKFTLGNLQVVNGNNTGESCVEKLAQRVSLHALTSIYG